MLYFEFHQLGRSPTFAAMFYRRKIILALLEVFGGRLKKINCQKLLFIISQRQIKPSYDFVPYKYGCFSYSASADLTAMVKHGFVLENVVEYEKRGTLSYISELTQKDRALINQVYLLFKNYDANGFMKYTYVHYPYYAINSIAADKILDASQMAKVNSNRRSFNESVLFTIGYEGISLEAYLNKLIKNGIKVLVDVRCNALSQKYGFSKSHLQNNCNNLGIEYVHLPIVGIQSEKRQQLVTQDDYDLLFDNYKQTVIPETLSTQIEILALLKKNKRIALTCYEANICQCHRKHLSEAITNLQDWDSELKHI